METAPKLKHFLWKLLSHGLPIGETLAARRMSPEVRCPHCLQPETTQHAFFDCYYTQQIWRASNIPLPVVYDPMIPYEEKIRALLKNDNKLPNDQKSLGVWILWRVWKARNQLLFQKRNSPWKTTLSLAYSDNREWRNEQDLVVSTQLPTTIGYTGNRISHWKRPPENWIKCNYDGSYEANTNIATLGWIFRDAQGVFRGAGSAAINPTNSALEGEFKALLTAMQAAWSKGYTNVIFEGDCKGLVDFITKKKINFSMYNYIREVWKWNAKFQAIEHRWIPRESNKAADRLATKVSPENSGFKFHNFIPMVLTDVLHYDYVISSI